MNKKMLGRQHSSADFSIRDGADFEAVDRRLQDIARRAAAEFVAANPGYRVEAFSGRKRVLSAGNPLRPDAHMPVDGKVGPITLAALGFNTPAYDPLSSIRAPEMPAGYDAFLSHPRGSIPAKPDPWSAIGSIQQPTVSPKASPGRGPDLRGPLDRMWANLGGAPTVRQAATGMPQQQRSAPGQGPQMRGTPSPLDRMWSNLGGSPPSSSRGTVQAAGGMSAREQLADREARRRGDFGVPQMTAEEFSLAVRDQLQDRAGLRQVRAYDTTLSPRRSPSASASRARAPMGPGRGPGVRGEQLGTLAQRIGASYNMPIGPELAQRAMETRNRKQAGYQTSAMGVAPPMGGIGQAPSKQKVATRSLAVSQAQLASMAAQAQSRLTPANSAGRLADQYRQYQRGTTPAVMTGKTVQTTAFPALNQLAHPAAVNSVRPAPIVQPASLITAPALTTPGFVQQPGAVTVEPTQEGVRSGMRSLFGSWAKDSLFSDPVIPALFGRGCLDRLQMQAA